MTEKGGVLTTTETENKTKSVIANLMVESARLPRSHVSGTHEKKVGPELKDTCCQCIAADYRCSHLDQQNR
jgi:hypothetical protein